MSLANLPRRASLIRKSQDAVVLIADEDAPPITSITAGASAGIVDFLTVYPEYTSLGWTGEDGFEWNRDQENADVMSHGAAEPTRRDIVSDVTSLAVTFQQTMRKTLELNMNLDLSSVTPTATTGELKWSKPTALATRYYRLLAISVDGAGENEILFARFLPRVTVSEVASTTWNRTDAIGYGITFTATPDDVLGTSLQEFWGGAWVKANLANMGFPALGA